MSDEDGFKPNMEIPLEYRLLTDITNNILNHQVKLKWDGWNGNSGTYQKQNAELKTYVKNGIPSSYRPLFWFRYSGAEILLKKYPGFYQK